MGASRITLYLRVRRGRFSSSRFAYAIGAAKGKLLVAAVWPLRGTVDHYIERVVDLTDPEENLIYNMSVAEARGLLFDQQADAVLRIQGSFALLAKSGKTVRMARSLDRPMRYFLAKRQEGPALIVASRVDTIFDWLKSEGLDGQFHPSYTRMVPAHYVVELQLVGCPDPDPIYTRFFTPESGTLPADLDVIGRTYIAALAEEIAQWLRAIPADEPIGVCFSGGIDSGGVFLTAYHVMRTLGMSPARLKAFVLELGDGPDVDQARTFLEGLGLTMFLEPIEADVSALDANATIRVVEDYKPLDIESATMALALGQGIRNLYPDWKHLIDGDGGDENLKDYPIEENPELTIRSVINNPMLYQEGWGVGKIKHSLTYSGGLSRSYSRTYATARHHGFQGFSPFTKPSVIAVAEAIPFIELTQYDVSRLYELKGEIVSRGVKAVTGLEMPVFPKRRFQHGAVSEESLHRRLPYLEADYRKQFLSLYQ
jgi:asparagine synthase (glutamine-hydrolysing)